MNWIVTLIFAITFFVLGVLNAATPPTSTEAQYFSSQNKLSNPGAELSLLSTHWISSGGTFARTTTTGEFSGGVAGFSWTASGSQNVRSNSWTIPTGVNFNGLAQCRFKTTASVYTFQVYDGTNVVVTQAIAANTEFTLYQLNFVGAATGTYSIRVIASGAGAEINWDDCYLGDAVNLTNVSQASVYGTIQWADTTNCVWSTSSATFANFAADADCPTPTVTGGLTAPGTKIPGFVWSPPPGNYVLQAVNGATGVTSGTIFDVVGTASTPRVLGGYRFSDGTNHSENNSTDFINDTTAAPQSTLSSLHGTVSYSTAQSAITTQLQGVINSGTSVNVNNASAGNSRSLKIIVYRFPTQSELAASPSTPAFPTIQKFTTIGAGTYTRPNGVVSIRVRMCGGGGGGAGSGTAAGAAATAGGNTTFGTSTAGGGNAPAFGNDNGAIGGTATLGSGFIGTAMAGNSGHGSTNLGAAAINGTMGGAGPFGGQTRGTNFNNTPSAGVANSCGGGNGAGNNALSGQYNGASGGAGGFIDALFHNPPATISLSVGADGDGGAAGTSGLPGADGGSGYIEVTEYYSAGQVPIFIGSVTSNSTGAERIERAFLNCDASAAINSQSGSWISSIANRIEGCTLTLATGMFSATPTCSWTIHNNITNAYPILLASSSTSVTVYARQNDNSAYLNHDGYLLCQGPR